MNVRFPAAGCLILLVLSALLAGCTSSSPVKESAPSVHATAIPEKTSAAEAITPAGSVADRTESIAKELASVRSGSPVFREAYRMFSNIRSTEYVHPPYTDDDSQGIYKFDCLGFVDHVLMNATPYAYNEIGKGANPSIESYSSAFGKLDTKSPIAMLGTRVQRPLDLQPGDVCLWLKPSTLDTGHMWIIAGEPRVNPKRANEVMVRIFDSTGTAHSDDSRTGSAWKTGLGTGILGFMVDAEGSPVGLYWEGGASTAAGEKDTTIICGRLTR